MSSLIWGGITDLGVVSLIWGGITDMGMVSLIWGDVSDLWVVSQRDLKTLSTHQEIDRKLPVLQLNYLVYEVI